MDFFESQDQARQNTARLVLLFALAVVSLILSVYLVVAFGLAFAGNGPGVALWNPGLFLAVMAATVAIVTIGSLSKIAQLRGGGRVVAESLGGRLIPQDTQDPDERKILNVVEEMAIASGTPVPPVYLMAGEKGINAFAAGYTPNDAVIGVTAGTIHQLGRSELQGVIAHEFSHILNGDMRLNIRLIGILNGILVLGLIGYYILRSVAYRPRVRTRNKNGGGAIVAILAIGAGLAVVGFMGTLFGNLIKAAVSRQREYLADASAVQFTRNPGSIANALRRIGGLAGGSGVTSPHAAEASHLFFAKALTSGLTSMFATHPALDERIRRIDPGWDGTYLPPRAIDTKPAGTAAAASQLGVDIAQVLTGTAVLGAAGEAGRRTSAVITGTTDGAVSQTGHPTMAHVDYAASLVRGLPESIRAATRDPYSARAVIYAMLVDTDTDIRRVQFEALREGAEPGLVGLVEELAKRVSEIRPEARIPLVDMTTPALRQLTPLQYGQFRMKVIDLERADARVSLFEWVLRRMILRHLEPHFREVETAPVKYHSLIYVDRALQVLLSALAHTGHDDPALVDRAFRQGRSRLNRPFLELLDRAQCGFETLDQALDTLNMLNFRLKRDLLAAGFACIASDRQITVDEGEMLRGISDALGCPMPPLIPA